MTFRLGQQGEFVLTVSVATCSTGYLHNHGRMWIAYVVHWQRIRWQVGVGFLSIYWMVIQPATICHGNGLRARLANPIFSTREFRALHGRNLCLMSLYGCDFEGSYEELEQRLFH